MHRRVGDSRETGDAMEPAIKHTYICGGDEWFSEKTEVSIAARSFAQGGMRKCHKCVEKIVEGSKVYSVESVAKFSIIHRDARSARAAAFADAKMQMVAEYWAQQFNIKSPPQHKVSFVVAQVLELPSRGDGPQRWASLEPLLSGEYHKFNNNAGAVLGGRLAQAFSHFTVHESSHQLCICDLQGVGGSLFTDPQIHATSGSYGDGNLGRSGINSFLSTHRCNEVCAALVLPPVEAKRPSASDSLGEGAIGVGGGRLQELMMRGGMGAGHGMSIPMKRMIEHMMEQVMRGQQAQIGNVYMNGEHAHHAGGGKERERVRERERGGGVGLQCHGGGGAGRAGAGADDLTEALRASKKAAQEEEDRNLRAALAASAGGRGGARIGGGGGGGDVDLQRALVASLQDKRANCSGARGAARR